jgi:hypothetical protein
MSLSVQIILIVLIGLCFMSIVPLSIIIIRDLKIILSEEDHDYDDKRN